MVVRLYDRRHEGLERVGNRLIAPHARSRGVNFDFGDHYYNHYPLPGVLCVICESDDQIGIIPSFLFTALAVDRPSCRLPRRQRKLDEP